MNDDAKSLLKSILELEEEQNLQEIDGWLYCNCECHRNSNMLHMQACCKPKRVVK